MSERRFTDQEVALILRRAVDLEKSSPGSLAPVARGLTLVELEDIAKEVGIDPQWIGRAARELEGGRGLEAPSLLGPAGVRRETRNVTGELSREEMGELMRLVDDAVAAQGTVVEALGTVRWTGGSRFLSTQVALEPSKGDTLIRVEERIPDRLRGMLHGIPAGYGAMFGVIAMGGLGLGVAGGVALAVAGAALGWGVGDALWRAFSARSRSRVRALMEGLGERAASMKALPGPPQDSSD